MVGGQLDFGASTGLHRVAFEPRFDAWRAAARTLLADSVPPERIDWQPEGEESQAALLPLPIAGTRLPAEGHGGEATRPARARKPSPIVPRAFVDLARKVACHRHPDRWSLLYRVLWRLAHGEPHLLKLLVDADVHRLGQMAKAVRRDLHKMKAFVRFRRAENDLGETWYIAWHRPDHRIVEAVAPFFVERFNDQRWMILTPDASASWDLETLRFGDGAPREAAPDGDALEDLWRTYYASIFNPARVKVKAMKAEMPVRHWATLPEATLIPGLLRDARQRVAPMVAPPRRPPARNAFPEAPTLAALAAALPRCRACSLCENGTRSVAGEGPPDARIVFVGEQPGDLEEQAGRPFVGPAGQVLERSLAAVGLEREGLYLTNTVKHFRYERQEAPGRSARRIHKTPGQTEVSACLPWLHQELALLRPQILVCLGATAARALVGSSVFGGQVKLRRDRGQPRATRHAPWTLITYHPSALLRIPEPAARQQAEEEFLADLRQVAAHRATLDRAQGDEERG